MNEYEILLTTIGCISCFFSFTVVFTVKLFNLDHNKIFVHTILMISLSDMIASFSLALGFPTGPLCVVQAAFINFSDY